MSDSIHVVSAVIIRGGRLLMTQRKPSQDFAFTWECPGGKVEAGEDHYDAMRRELWEEIGAVVESFVPVAMFDRDFGNIVQRADRARVHVFLHRVEIVGEPSPREGQGIGWFGVEEVALLPMAPANTAARQLLLSLIRLQAATRRPA